MQEENNTNLGIIINEINNEITYNNNSECNFVKLKANKLINKKERSIINNSKIKKQSKKKIDDKNFTIPKFEEYKNLDEYDYKLHHLKDICKHYKLLRTGTKLQLTERIYSYLKNSIKLIKIQAVWRGALTRKWLKYHGPAYNNKKVCVNEQDFLSFEDLCDLKIDQFFSYKDKDNFIYGFDIISIYNLIYQQDKRSFKSKILNPYNRNIIDDSVVRDLNKLIKLSKILKREISIEIPKEEDELNVESVIRCRIVNVFQNIDLLGHYTQPQWFENLNIMQLKRFLKELCDIWMYRAQITLNTKLNIYPPNGEPFSGIYGGSMSGLIQINTVNNLIDLQKNSLTVIERMVNSGINNDFKNLGAYYILTALTIVSSEAALALPWLFEAASAIGN